MTSLKNCIYPPPIQIFIDLLEISERATQYNDKTKRQMRTKEYCILDG